MPKFSVVIPLFNKENDIKNTIESVISQNYSNFEIIIINDGSTDKSIAVVKGINDPRIRSYTQENQGVSKARNFGVEMATSDYIAFLDADDYWYPNHLENFKNLLEEYPYAKWLATAYEKKRNQKLVSPMVTNLLKKGENWMGEVNDYFKNCLIDSLVNSSNVCFKKTFFNSLRGFNSEFTHGEDTDLWIRAALKSRLVFSNKTTAQHNLLGSNRSSEIQISNRNYFDINAFSEEEKQNPSLQKYLDLNRYSQAIKHQLSGDKLGFNRYRKKINLENLNSKQQFLLKQSKTGLQLIFKLQKTLERLGLRVSSF